ncbi:hypothetical protein HIM_09214 [Hirsutella minnesotensis 3608]|uniref:Uncharacterized protein n=1 Tax=Hirsutella minnesotensis 3608 TaxID=1043627 RepID=A0A0F7ZGT0_9HYPO|nr:hypothetical protein HIM_09214 [Hirsutella minnesotensis 3608]
MPRVSLSFFPQGRSIPPWAAIHTDLYLPGDQWHGVILALQPAPRFEYSPYPAANPHDLLALGLCQETIDPDTSQPSSVLSPLILPSPIQATQEQPAFQAPPRKVDGQEASAKGQKRVIIAGASGQAPPHKKAKR